MFKEFYSKKALEMLEIPNLYFFGGLALLIFYKTQNREDYQTQFTQTQDNKRLF